MTYIPKIRVRRVLTLPNFYRTLVYLGSDLWVPVSDTHSLMLCWLYWCDSGWWRYQLNSSWWYQVRHYEWCSSTENIMNKVKIYPWRLRFLWQIDFGNFFTLWMMNIIRSVPLTDKALFARPLPCAKLHKFNRKKFLSLEKIYTHAVTGVTDLYELCLNVRFIFINTHK